MEELILDGEKLELPERLTKEEMDDTLLLDEDLQTSDLTEVIEQTKEIDWSKDE